LIQLIDYSDSWAVNLIFYTSWQSLPLNRLEFLGMKWLNVWNKIKIKPMTICCSCIADNTEICLRNSIWTKMSSFKCQLNNWRDLLMLLAKIVVNKLRLLKNIGSSSNL
jgi:hypothetical protein